MGDKFSFTWLYDKQNYPVLYRLKSLVRKFVQTNLEMIKVPKVFKTTNNRTYWELFGDH